MNTYSSNVEERSRIDEILLNNGKREKVKVSVNMPILEKAYDDFIGLISKECKGKLSEKEKKDFTRKSYSFKKIIQNGDLIFADSLN